MTFHLGLATTLSPAASGPAEFVTGVLPQLARTARITCFVEHPDQVDAHLREYCAIRPLTERADPSVDLLVYHIANNLIQAAVYDAAMDGPPGLLEIHDGSLHHMLATQTIGASNPGGYQDLLASAHGRDGAALARLRLREGHPPGIEQFMFDLLKDLLDRHLGALVHNRYAADLIALRAPSLPIWVVPLSAPPPAPAVDRAILGLPPDTLVIAHFGFVTPPKRPYLLLEAFARLRAAGCDCHLLFAGRDDTAGQLTAEIRRLGLEGHVSVTGYLDREEMDRLIATVDIVVSLRFPHVGETSATLGAALGAGRPVVVQETGSWSELPEQAVLRIPAVGDEVAALTEALHHLATQPQARARLGAAAGAYAAQQLGVDRYASGVVEAARALSHSSRVPPAQQVRERRAAIDALFAAGDSQLTTATLLAGPNGTGVQRDHLARIPPARPGGRLLDVTTDAPGAASLLRLLECVWGYEVRSCQVGPSGDPERGRGRLGRTAPGGHFDRAADSAPGSAHTGALAPGTIGELPYECATFDTVSCGEGLPADPAPRAALLAEINRVLRPGGILVLSVGVQPGPLAVQLDRAGLSTEGIVATGPASCSAVARKVAIPISA